MKDIIIVQHEVKNKVFTATDGKIDIKHLKEAYPGFKNLTFVSGGVKKTLKSTGHYLETIPGKTFYDVDFELPGGKSLYVRLIC